MRYAIVFLGLVTSLISTASASPLVVEPAHHLSSTVRRDPATTSYQSVGTNGPLEFDEAGDYLFHILGHDHLRSRNNLGKRDNEKRAAHERALSKFNELYESKYHDDDHYAQWAADLTLDRGPYHSRGIRQLLYSHPSTYYL